MTRGLQRGRTNDLADGRLARRQRLERVARSELADEEDCSAESVGSSDSATDGREDSSSTHDEDDEEDVSSVETHEEDDSEA
jgi:hypothetical protein